MSARRLSVTTELDVADAARAARQLAGRCGLAPVEAQHVATAVSEVATNAVKYGLGGEVFLQAAERDGRAGVEVCVRDAGPGIPDLAAAMRDGTSTGGSLGLGLPAARRLMDAFAVETGAGGTVVRMARWAGGPRAGDAAVSCTVLDGAGGEALAQPYRNGTLLALAAGPRAEGVVRTWRTRPWHAPARLAAACVDALEPGERLGLALAAFSDLDRRLEWLSAGAVTAALVRAGRIVARPAGGRALARGASASPAATVEIRRDDVLVLAAAPLEDAALLALTRPERPAGAAAALVARFAAGTLERRPRVVREGPHRRRTDPSARSTLERP